MTEGRIRWPPWPALVFGVCDMFYVSGPAASTAAAYVALLTGRAVAIFINNG